MAETDLILLERFVMKRDEDAFAEIVRRYTGLVYAACRRILRDRARAEEIAQETFFLLFRRPDAVSRSLGGWLHRSATRLAIDTVRSDSSRQRREAQYARAHTQIDDAVAWQDISPHIDTALDELPTESRMLLVEHFLRAVPQKQLAESLGVSAPSVSRRLKRATAELREKLRRRGVLIGAAALGSLLAVGALEAAPAALGRELAKMVMVSGMEVRGAAPPPAEGGLRSWLATHRVDWPLVKVLALRSVPLLFLCLMGMLAACAIAAWVLKDASYRFGDGP